MARKQESLGARIFMRRRATHGACATAAGLLVFLAPTAHAAPAGAPATAERFVPRSTAKHFQLGAAHFPIGAGKSADLGRSEATSPAMRSLDGAPSNAREENAFPSERHAGSASFPIRWQSQPEIVRQVRDLRRRGLPIVHLWQSTHALVAIGLNKHGVPGIYITQRAPD